MPNMFGGDQLDPTYAPWAYRQEPAVGSVLPRPVLRKRAGRWICSMPRGEANCCVGESTVPELAYAAWLEHYAMNHFVDAESAEAATRRAWLGYYKRKEAALTL